MLGAIFGDIVGSVYEFHNTDREDFPLLSKFSRLTDDSIMSIAVCEALMNTLDKSTEEKHEALVQSMQKYGRAYPRAGYGGRFRHWLREEDPKPYGSYGNGSGMRVSSVGWLCGSLEETLQLARVTAEVTHDHPEGIKGAQAIASLIYLARAGVEKEEMKSFVEAYFGYDLHRTLDEVKKSYGFFAICQKSVPEAILAFLEGCDYESVVRKAVALGGDSDTIACMAGGIAEAYYGMPVDLKEMCLAKIARKKDLAVVVNAYHSFVCARGIGHGDAVEEIKLVLTARNRG